MSNFLSGPAQRPVTKVHQTQYQNQGKRSRKFIKSGRSTDFRQVRRKYDWLCHHPLLAAKSRQTMKKAQMHRHCLQKFFSVVEIFGLRKIIHFDCSMKPCNLCKFLLNYQICGISIAIILGIQGYFGISIYGNFYC